MADSPEAPDATLITRKRGRPKGSKNKPKWWPKPAPRPRGRPKGAKTKPKDQHLQDVILQALEATVIRPPKSTKAQREKSKAKRRSQRTNQTKNMRPKERVQWAKRMNEASQGKTGRKGGVPTGWNYKDYAVEVEEAQKHARKTFNIMAEQGLVPDDEMAQAALLEALTILKNKATSPQVKLSAGRLLLDYTRAKPATKSDVTIHKAESLLEALAAQEPDGPEDS